MSTVKKVHACSGQPSCHVVFLHGLGGSIEETWKSRKTGDFWPAFVGETVGDIDVFCVGYSASPSKWLGSAMPLHDRAAELIETMRVNNIFDRPVVFVAHSLGGLLVKQILRLVWTHNVEDWQAIRGKIRGVSFIATPHSGSDIPRYLSALPRVLRLSEPMTELERNSALLRELNTWFRNNFSTLDLRVRVFYETLKTAKLTVVDASSADPGIPGITLVPIDANHLEIAKPSRGNTVVLSTIDLARAIISSERAPGKNDPVAPHRAEATVPRKDNDLLSPFRTALQTSCKELAWWDAPINVLARSSTGSGDARERIASWVENSKPRHCVLLGPPGSGKSGLALWATAEITKRIDSFALLVPCGKLSKRQGALRFADVIETAIPSADPLAQESIRRLEKLFVVLDGLDELSGIQKDGQTIASKIIRDVISVLPENARIIATCRSHAFPVFAATLEEVLPVSFDDDDDFDESVFEKTFNSKDLVAVFELQPISDSEAFNYLGEKLKSILSEFVERDARWSFVLRSPVLLSVAREALPKLIKDEPAVDRLYAAYVRQSLRKAMPQLGDRGVIEAIESLKGYSNFLDPVYHEEHLKFAQQAGLLRVERGSFEWMHLTFWEFFFSLYLLADIRECSAKTLAQVDLVSGYNVNRMLVPMITRLMRKSDLSKPGIVTTANFRKFVNETNWRDGIGYGVHPSVSVSASGVHSASKSINVERDYADHTDYSYASSFGSAASQISWYDAAAYCLKNDVRLPTSREIAKLELESGLLYWCSDWFNEETSHLCAFDAEAGTILGLNPDLRLKNTALAIA